MKSSIIMTTSSSKQRGHVPASVLKLLTAKCASPSCYKVIMCKDVDRQEPAQPSSIWIQPMHKSSGFSSYSALSSHKKRFVGETERHSTASNRPPKTEDELAFPLSKTILFSEWPQEKIVLLRNNLTPEYVPYGDVLMVEGRPVFHIIFLLSGEISALKKVVIPGQQTAFRKFATQSDRLADSSFTKTVIGEQQDVSDVKIACKGKGAVFGEAAALLGRNANETLKVESRTGAIIWKLNAADLYHYFEASDLAKIQQKLRNSESAVSEWEAQQAIKQAETITAVEDEQTKMPTYIAFPSRSELNAISQKLREELVRPLQWTQKKNRPNSAMRSGGMSDVDKGSFAHFTKTRRPQSAMGRLTRDPVTKEKESRALYGPSDYLGVGRMLTGQMQVRVKKINESPVGFLGTICHDGVIEHKYDVTRRQLFLNSWQLPNNHRVYMGSKVGSIANSSKDVPHVEMDVDSINNLDGFAAAS